MRKQARCRESAPKFRDWRSPPLRGRCPTGQRGVPPNARQSWFGFGQGASPEPALHTTGAPLSVALRHLSLKGRDRQSRVFAFWRVPTKAGAEHGSVPSAGRVAVLRRTACRLALQNDKCQDGGWPISPLEGGRRRARPVARPGRPTGQRGVPRWCAKPVQAEALYGMTMLL